MSDVIQIGDIQFTAERVRLTMPTSVYKSRLSEVPEKVAECGHRKLILLTHGDILKCEECGDQVSAVWALRRYIEQCRQHEERLTFQQRSLELERDRGVTLRAAQKIEDAWRRRKTVPCCPHCNRAILPDSNFGDAGVSANSEVAKQAQVLAYRPVRDGNQ